jgi:general stress protein 26
MTLEHLVAFVRRHALAVQSSVSASGSPQAAVVGVVADDDFEIFFDTRAGSRKCRNLRRDARIALVIGWDLEEACTLQVEGRADEPRGEELERWKKLYFARFPDGVERQAWPDITYFRVRPAWARFSDFRTPEPTIVELSEEELRRPARA